MTKTITLSFNDTPARIIDREGQPWFLGMDTVPVLGLTNAGMAYSKLDEDERCYISRTDLGLSPGRQMTLISESGLYKLAYISRFNEMEAELRQPIAPSSLFTSQLTHLSYDGWELRVLSTPQGPHLVTVDAPATP